MFRAISKYFTVKFTPSVRYLHYSVLLLVLLQIAISNFIEIDDNGKIGQNIIEYYSTWMHISAGLLIIVLAFVFEIIELSKHGFLYFYPYLSGDFSQLKTDLSKLKSFELPDTSAKGLAAVIQGLGLGALLLVALSGAIWFVLWIYDSPLANEVKDIHELFTGLIEAYVIGHGGMGLIHIFLVFKEQKNTNN